MHWPERGQIYFYASSPDAAAWMLKFVFVYLANTTVLCYSLTIIFCCQVQDYIYWIISTENDYSHHHKFIKYEKRLRKEGKNMLGTSLSSFQRSNWSPTYILHLLHLEDTSRLFIFLSESVKVRFLPRVDTFSFAQAPHVVYRKVPGYSPGKPNLLQVHFGWGRRWDPLFTSLYLPCKP
jgi:hypothetical protein